MPFVPVANTAYVEVIMSVLGQEEVNTSYVEFPAAIEEADLEELAETYISWWKANMRAMYTVDGTLVAVRATSQTDSISPSWEIGVTADNVGTAVGNTLPNSSAFTITFLTANRGRSYRGRNYIGAIPIDQTTDPNHVEVAYANALVSKYEILRGLITGITRTLVVVSKYSGINETTGKPIPRIAGVTTPVTGFRYRDLVIDSQRRRLPGRGR